MYLVLLIKLQDILDITDKFFDRFSREFKLIVDCRVHVLIFNLDKVHGLLLNDALHILIQLASKDLEPIHDLVSLHVLFTFLFLDSDLIDLLRIDVGSLKERFQYFYFLFKFFNLKRI